MNNKGTLTLWFKRVDWTNGGDSAMRIIYDAKANVKRSRGRLKKK